MVGCFKHYIDLFKTFPLRIKKEKGGLKDTENKIKNKTLMKSINKERLIEEPNLYETEN